jgi:hypothetical protein
MVLTLQIPQATVHSKKERYQFADIRLIVSSPITTKMIYEINGLPSLVADAWFA